jgi:adenylate cyclase
MAAASAHAGGPDLAYEIGMTSQQRYVDSLDGHGVAMPQVVRSNEQPLEHLDHPHTHRPGTATMREVLGRFTTPEVAGMVLSAPRDFWNKAERRVLTTLFADVRDFTPFVAKVPPEEAAATINVIFGCLYDAIKSERGIVNRFAGDGMLALFGAPLSLENHVAAAAMAALKARAAIELLAETRRTRGLEPLRIGLGINTGELLAGCVGTPERTEYTVVGHAVNLASRLVALADAGQILLGAETADLLGPHFEVQEKGVMNLKGIGLTPVFELVGPSSTAAIPAAAAAAC